jgi:malonate transporter
MGLGILFRRIGLLDEKTVHRLNSLLYWAALPALLFRSILGVGSGILSEPNLFCAVHSTFLFAPAIAFIVARMFTKDRRKLAVSVFTSIRSNNVFMGIPAVTIAMGQEGLKAVSFYLAVSLVGYNFISITWAQAALSGRPTLKSLRDTLFQLLKNPLIVASIMGVGAAWTGLRGLPFWLDTAVKMVGDTGSGIALIALGSSISFEGLGAALRSAWRDSLFKLFVYPSLVWCAFLVWPVDSLLRDAVVLVSAMPAAVNCFVIAHKMGMDSEYAGKIVTLSTALSVFSLPIWIVLLKI